MSDARTVITEYLNSSLSKGGQGWTTQQHASAIIVALTEAGLIIVNKDEVERLRVALEEIASGRYSGLILPSYPPQDPAVVRARKALENKDV
jgi:hypothetical protein